MNDTFAIVITSIHQNSKAIEAYARHALEWGEHFFVIGDKKNSDEEGMKGCDYYSLIRQQRLPFKLVTQCPENNYARKNIGYLLAIQTGYDVIVETDDDNFPLDSFWNAKARTHTVPSIKDCGWFNIYQHFSQEPIWPRGFPLEYVRNQIPSIRKELSQKFCPIQQGLAQHEPDIDAVCRMIIPHKGEFLKDTFLALGQNAWCPFNSQNTTWFKEAHALMYLPSYCSFRMCDIWRGFVAQRVIWTCGWNILFQSPNVYQERNVHSLLQDFEEEIPGFLNNVRICQMLQELSLLEGTNHIHENLFRCYQALVDKKWISEKELPLLELWIHDLQTIGQ